jgi:purine-cytosine permease-like protein
MEDLHDDSCWRTYLFRLLQPAGHSASGIANTLAWSGAYDVSPCALILAGYDGLGGFGKFCGVIIALGLGSNMIASNYAAALDFQVLGRTWRAVPRYVWATIIAVIYFVCVAAGRDHLILIFQNFLARMGYCLAIFITIVLEEHTIFRRHVGFNWSAWEDEKRLPVRAAALIAFLVGWVGPIAGIYQVWWTGPVARKLGDAGADLGIWLGIRI